MMTTRLEQTASAKTVAGDALKAIYFLRSETKQSHLLQGASQRMNECQFDEKHFACPHALLPGNF